MHSGLSISIISMACTVDLTAGLLSIVANKITGLLFISSEECYLDVQIYSRKCLKSWKPLGAHVRQRGIHLQPLLCDL